MVEPGAGEPAQRREIDVDVVKVVVTRHQSGQHAGVGRMDIACDQRQPHAGDRVHPEPLEHRNVGVPAAYQDEVLDDGDAALHHLDARVRTRVTGPANASGAGSRLMTRNASLGKSKK